MRIGNVFGIMVGAAVILAPHLNTSAQWTMTSPQGASSRTQVQNVQGGGFASAADTLAADFGFGFLIGGDFFPEKEETFSRQNAAGTWFWTGTLTPPAGLNNRWTASPLDPMTAMPVGQHYAWIIDINGQGDGTANHVVTVAP